MTMDDLGYFSVQTGGQVVGGSNPLAPTNFNIRMKTSAVLTHHLRPVGAARLAVKSSRPDQGFQAAFRLRPC